jgi:aminopeptidase N
VESEGTLVRDLVLVAGRDLESRSATVGDTTVTSWYRAPDARAAQVALEMATSALASFEARFGPYPYTELDVVEASLVGGAGGVEFSAMVLIAGMLYRDPSASTSQLALMLNMLSQVSALLHAGMEGAPADSSWDMFSQLMDVQLQFTVAHEVGHQYFAGLVGNDSQRFPSLDEPLAQYLAGLAFEDRFGREQAQAATDLCVKLNYALYRLMGGADRPVLRDTNSYTSTLEYAGLVYGKAPYLYEALRLSLGEEPLHAAMRSAVQTFRFRIVSTEEWVSALEAFLGGEGAGVRTAFRRWLEETHGDEDLDLADPAQYVLEILFPPDGGAALEESMSLLGMRPGDLLRMLFGAGLGTTAPWGPGLNPDDSMLWLQ